MTSVRLVTELAKELTSPRGDSDRSLAKKMVVPIPDIKTRTWKTMEEVKAVFTEQQIVQIVHRYCDSQDHAKNYRTRKAEEFKSMKARLAEIDGQEDS